MSFLYTYGNQILYTILTGIIAFVGTWLGKQYEKSWQQREKEKVTSTCVKAVEQLYPDLHGQEKYCKAVESIREILVLKNIQITDLEIRMLIEAQCHEFNKERNKEKK